MEKAYIPIQIKRAIKDCAKKEKDVVCVYLFGSFASGTAQEGSDIDIAILFDSSVDKKEYSQRSLFIVDSLSVALDKNVDVVVLNTANSFLKFRVIKDGIRIYENPNKGSRSFETRALIEYYDFFLTRQILENALIDHIKRG